MPTRTATYAVLWREGEGASRVGRLELGATRLQLMGGGVGGRLFSLSLRYSDLADLAMARPPMRLSGQPTVEVGRSEGRPLRISSFDGLGATREIFERLAKLVSGAAAA